MIGILLDRLKKFLETSRDTTLSLKLENPIFFDPDKISPGSYSLPFDLPSSNLPSLKNPQVIENNESYVPESATIFFDGMPFKKGKININTIQQNISSYFTFGLNSISDSFKEANLRDVLSHTVVIASNSVVKKVHTDAQQINIVMNGVSYGQKGWYYRRIPVGPTTVIPHSYPDGPTTTPVAMIQQVATNSPGDRIVGTHYVVKMVTFQYVNDIIFGPVLTPIDCTDPNVELHVEVNQDASAIPFIMQPELDGYYDEFIDWLNPFLTNDIPADDWLKYLRFPTISSAKLNAYREGVVVNHQNGVGDIILNTPERSYVVDIAAPANINSIQPFVTLRGVLQKIGDYFDFSYEGDFWDDARLDYTTIWNTTALDLSQQYIQQQYFNFWRRSFNFNELVPDITVVDFFKLLQSSFNIAIYYNEQTGKVRLKWRENIARSLTYNDITSKTSNIRGITPVTIKTNAPVKNLAASFSSMDLSVINFFIDTINTIVTNESSSGADDGEIEVATISDVALFEFSINNGGSWQSSNVFSGLTTGIYIIQARELATAIVNEYPFALNHGDVDFEFNPVVFNESAPGENDGGINVVMASELGFSFSKDAGVTWQSEDNTFNGLSPGPYYVAVKRNSTGNVAVVVVVIGRDYDTDLLPSIPLFDYKQDDDFSLQFFKYEGLRTIDGYSYPYLSVYSFPTWPIWNKMMLKCLSVKADITLNLIDIRNIDWELKRRFDRTNYLIKSLDISITNRKVKVTQAELYTLR